MSRQTLLDNQMKKLSDEFTTSFGSTPHLVSRAPGRVNLIGEHTDYNDGFVFPVAIDRQMLIAASPATDGDSRVDVISMDYGEKDSFNLDNLERAEDHFWANYVRGSIKVLKEAGYQPAPFKAVLSGDVPQGSGLSSSAALSVALIQLQNELAGLQLTKVDIALFAQKIENNFIGVQCGIMDQFISALGESESALFIDCRSLEYRTVPLNLSAKSIAIVVTNSGVQRGLVDSEYNARRSECSKGVEMLKSLLNRDSITALRDVSLDEFKRVESKLPEVVARRCRHVISENERVIHAVNALESGDLSRLGEYMDASHISLRDDFQVSVKELDLLVGLTRKHKGVIGARMTGAGFGGCTVALMEASAVESFKKSVIAEYESESGRRAEVHECRAVGGAEVL